MAVDVFPIWKAVSNIEHGPKKGTLGKTAIWSVIEKNLFRQRVFPSCVPQTGSMYPYSMKEPFNPDESGINTKVLEDMTGPTEAFKIASGEMTPGDYANDDTNHLPTRPWNRRQQIYKRQEVLRPDGLSQWSALMNWNQLFSDRCMWFYHRQGELRHLVRKLAEMRVTMDEIENVPVETDPLHQLLCQHPRPLQALRSNIGGQEIRLTPGGQIEGRI